MDIDRYKQRSAKFSSAQDARVGRALASRVDRKAQREKGRLGRRNLNISDELDESDLSFQSGPEKKCEPKKTYEEMQEELYQQLIQYKKNKKKTIELEKRHRQPVFQTGGFTPDKPKFLVGIDSDNFVTNKSENKKITPFKFMKSSTRTGSTPGGSSASKSLKFRSGATPDMSRKENQISHPVKSSGVARKRILTENKSLNVSSSHISKEKVRKLGSTRPSFKQSKKSRAQMRMDAVTAAQLRLETTEELGVAELPSSPAISKAAVETSKPIDSRKSFAPDDFKFGFKGLVAQIKAKAMGIMEDTGNMTLKDVPSKENIFNEYKSFSKKTKFVTKDKSECLDQISEDENKVDHMNHLKVSTEVKEYVGKDVEKENESTLETKADEYDSSKELESSVTETRKFKDQEKSASDTKSDKEFSKIQDSDLEFDSNPSIGKVVSQGEDCNASSVTEVYPNVVSSIDSIENQTDVHTEQEPEVNEIEPVTSETNIKEDKNEDIVTENEVNVFVPNEVTSICEDSLEMMEVDEYSSNANTPYHNVLKNLSAQKSKRRSLSSSKKSMSCTPSKRRSSHFKSCCDTGSPMTRLRPRTPCSRSTRRSIAAHTDNPLNISLTPGRRSSARKSLRRSLAISIRTEERVSASPIQINKSISSSENKGKPENNTYQDDKSIIDKPSDKEQTDLEHSESKNTPVNNENKEGVVQIATPLDDISGSVSRRKGRGRVSWMVECSPYVTTSRGSSKRESRRVSRINSDLNGLFDDIPTDGSPLPDYLVKASSPGISDAVEAPISDANICTNLLSLLQPTSPEKCITPDVNVWGEDTPNDTPLKLLQTENDETTTVSEAALSSALSSYIEEQKVDSPMYSKTNEGMSTQKLQRRKSRRSVMFAEGSAIKEHSGVRFPGTPIKNTTRVSMGLFAAVDVNTTDPNISPSQNLMFFDSPKSETKNRGKRNSSMRMSLLPIVETPFGGKQADGHRQSQLPEDLISWDSPETKRRMSNAAALATPRRSRRLSKTIVE